MGETRQDGFILVLVLSMLVVLSVLAGGIAAVTGRLRNQAEDRRLELQGAIDIASTRATLYYLLTTQPMTIGGLTIDDRITTAGMNAQPAGFDDGSSVLPQGNEITLDGSAHRGLGVARFALQDDRGLYGVNVQPPASLERLIQGTGSTSATPASVLIDRLLDYQDKDDLYRLNSMEREGYAKLGLPPPSNRPLSTPMELLRIPGWKEALAGVSTRSINDALSVEYTGLVNVNTAPQRVLRTINGVDADMAARVVERRKVQPFLTEAPFFEFLGLPITYESGISMYPSTSGTLRLWSVHGGRAQLVHWTLTPTDEGGRPWREDYELIQSHDWRLDDAALPVRSKLFAKPLAAAN